MRYGAKERLLGALVGYTSHMSEDERLLEEDSEPTEDDESRTSRGGAPTIRETQGPMGQPASKEGTWVSGDDRNDPLRIDAAERARRAVEPGRPRE